MQDKVLISDQGRSVLTFFGTTHIFTDRAKSSTYRSRFNSPDKIKSFDDDMWSFGGLCYEVMFHTFAPPLLTNVLTSRHFWPL